MEVEKEAVPGMELGVEEEFAEGPGTYSSDGKIYSALFGKVVVTNRRISVIGRKMLSKISVGDIIYGRVEMIVEPVALILTAQPPTPTKFYESMAEYAVMHASSLGIGFVRNIHDFVKIGDIIKARVIDIKPTEVSVGVNSHDLGIIKAFCTQDRHPMNLVSRMLVCSHCGKKETRKISSEYGKSIMK
ncbi:MAG: exosome complex RNA-binding protein Csl4 [Candidatus Anstonellales archaeon]